MNSSRSSTGGAVAVFPSGETAGPSYVIANPLDFSSGIFAASGLSTAAQHGSGTIRLRPRRQPARSASPGHSGVKSHPSIIEESNG